ncbi:MAG: class I SAM-dependent methyltransferase [Bacteroidales bacterium]|nr:class I SAM-dependent methyltransferase [Bacteroidales bacterium]MBN2756762.1 class I SAM-dependent methyltransferase [Bacteroidales bacterium]
MNETFDSAYIKDKHYFGDEADVLLKNHYKLLNKNDKILDIGIGQGRNALFLIEKGFIVDGVDPSIVGIEALKKLAYKDKLKLELFNTDFKNFNPKEAEYSGILIFGLIQLLSEKDIKELAKKTKKMLNESGLIFLTGFSKKDESFKPNSSNWTKINEYSYTDNNNNFRTFLDADELLKYFKHFNVIYKWEGLGQKHRHNDGPLEQHHYFELILQKQ